MGRTGINAKVPVANVQVKGATLSMDLVYMVVLLAGRDKTVKRVCHLYNLFSTIAVICKHFISHLDQVVFLLGLSVEFIFE